MPQILKVEETLGPLEQQVIKAVWKKNKTTVREILFDLKTQRKFAYTTIMTVMDKLYKKGFLKREKIKKTYYYLPVTTYSKLVTSSIKKVISDLYLNYGKRKIFFIALILLLNFKVNLTPFYYGFVLSTFFSFGVFFLIQFFEGLTLSGFIDYIVFALSNINIFIARLHLFIQLFIEALPITELFLSLILLITSLKLFRKLKVFKKLAL